VTRSVKTAGTKTPPPAGPLAASASTLRLGMSRTQQTAARVSDPADDDVTRRTQLAAERTWLAWWRSGIAMATAAVAVGGVVPELVAGGRAAYVVLGAGYAALAIAVFVASALRQHHVAEALRRGEYAAVGDRVVLALTLAAVALAVGTLVVIVAQA
jgi:putative membrane protein